MTIKQRAEAISARVRQLIELHHHGDANAAARRLGVAPAQLGDLLSGDWRRFSLDALAALVPTYGISVAWLLTGGQHAPDDPTRTRR